MTAPQASQEPIGTAGPWSAIDGLDCHRALLFLPGQEALARQLLQRFASQYQAGLPALGPLLASGAPSPQARAEAGRALHSLRGACGAIGALALLAQAQQLEQALAAGAASPLATQAAALEQGLARLVSQIASALA
jgi:two-component system, sensor histidine kinase and response regulator